MTVRICASTPLYDGYTCVIKALYDEVIWVSTPLYDEGILCKYGIVW